MQRWFQISRVRGGKSGFRDAKSMWDTLCPSYVQAQLCTLQRSVIKRALCLTFRNPPKDRKSRFFLLAFAKVSLPTRQWAPRRMPPLSTAATSRRQSFQLGVGSDSSITRLEGLTTSNLPGANNIIDLHIIIVSTESSLGRRMNQLGGAGGKISSSFGGLR